MVLSLMSNHFGSYMYITGLSGACLAKRGLSQVSVLLSVAVELSWMAKTNLSVAERGLSMVEYHRRRETASLLWTEALVTLPCSALCMYTWRWSVCAETLSLLRMNTMIKLYKLRYRWTDKPCLNGDGRACEAHLTTSLWDYVTIYHSIDDFKDRMLYMYHTITVMSKAINTFWDVRTDLQNRTTL